jgi:transcriptional regulator NrdR family protein
MAAISQLQRIRPCQTCAKRQTTTNFAKETQDLHDSNPFDEVGYGTFKNLNGP